MQIWLPQQFGPDFSRVRKPIKSGDTGNGMSPPDLRESGTIPHENYANPSTYETLGERGRNTDSDYQTLSHVSQEANYMNVDAVYYNAVSEPTKDSGPGSTADQTYEAYEQVVGEDWDLTNGHV